VANTSRRRVASPANASGARDGVADTAIPGVAGVAGVAGVPGVAGVAGVTGVGGAPALGGPLARPSPATNMTGASWTRNSGGYEFMLAGDRERREARRKQCRREQCDDLRQRLSFSPLPTTGARSRMNLLRSHFHFASHNRSLEMLDLFVSHAFAQKCSRPQQILSGVYPLPTSVTDLVHCMRPHSFFPHVGASTLDKLTETCMMEGGAPCRMMRECS
jgi:hypothetical protein